MTTWAVSVLLLPQPLLAMVAGPLIVSLPTSNCPWSLTFDFLSPDPLLARSLAVEPCHDNLFRLPLALHRTLFRRRLVLYGEATLELSQPHRREVTLHQHLPNGTPDPVSREVEGREHRAPLNDADEQTANYGSQDGDPGSVPPHPHPFLLLCVTTETLLRPPSRLSREGSNHDGASQASGDHLLVSALVTH